MEIGNAMLNTNMLSALAKMGDKGDERVNKVARQFEEMALSQLLAFADTDNDMSDSMFGGGAGERAFKPFLMDEYAKGFAEVGGIGIGKTVRAEILKIQEAAKNNSRSAQLIGS